METLIKKGARIIARVTAQGMIAGHRYEVTDTHITSTPFGAIVQYQLDGAAHWVQNLPFLADIVEEGRAA